MFQGESVTLEEMLACRERRAYIQQQFLSCYLCPVISFCLNIPGPVKTTPEILQAFLLGQEKIKQVLASSKQIILDETEFHEKTGDEWILCIDADPDDLKQQMSVIEDRHPLGRLFDIDVLDASGNKRSREHYRTCLICDRQAQECARTRKHSIVEMQEAIERMLNTFL